MPGCFGTTPGSPTKSSPLLALDYMNSGLPSPTFNSSLSECRGLVDALGHILRVVRTGLHKDTTGPSGSNCREVERSDPKYRLKTSFWGVRVELLTEQASRK